MALNELPNLWTSDSLGELVIVERGSSPRPIKNYLTEDNGVNWIKIGDVKEGQKYVTKTKEQITKEGAEKSRFVKVGDFILSNSMSFGRPYIMAIDGYIHDGWFALRLPKDINSDYFYYLLSSSYVQDQFSQLAVGGVVKNISGDLVKKAELPLPPLAEQKVIAEKLDKLLAKVDSIKASLDAVPDTLKRFRQSVLAAAVSGKLTDSDCTNWNEKPLKELTSKIGSGSTPRGGSSAYKSEGIPLVRSLNIHTDFIKYEDLAFIDSQQAQKLVNVTIEPEDVLLNITGASIGRVNLTPIEFIGGRVNQHVSIIRCNKEILQPNFLKLMLASPDIQKWIQGENYGATRQALTKGMIENLKVNLPSVEEQTEIVRRVEKLFAYADKVEAEVNAAQERVNKLTQSILAKAFRGELTGKWREQNPELISGDNSAEALLEKIKAEREKLKPTKKRKAK